MSREIDTEKWLAGLFSELIRRGIESDEHVHFKDSSIGEHYAPTLQELRGEVSSQAVIKSGKNRGFRRKETAGTWILAGGFCYESRQESKWPHYSWSAALHRLGFRVGILDREGTRDFFIFMTPASACKTHTNAV